MRIIHPDQAGEVPGVGYTKHILLEAEDLAAEGTRVQIVTIAPGNTVAEHFHRHTREFYYVLQGACLLTVDGAEMALAPGDMLLMEPHDVHRLTNRGPGPFQVLVFKTNAGDDTHWA